jgi:disintegrin and metalloproteinase domain-containing protein 10
MKTLCWLVVVLGQIFLAFSDERRPLNKFIHHYEPLNYAESDIKDGFENGLPTKSLDFEAHGRDFKLRLEPDRDTFHPGLEGMNEQMKSHLKSALAGKLEDEPDSEAFGSIRDGKFEGTIFTNDGEYTVRPAEMFFEEPQEFHSVIYRSSDEDEGLRRKRSLFSSDDEPRSERRRRETNEFDEPDSFNLYSQGGNKFMKVCNISIEADHLFTEVWGNDTGRAIGEMVYLVRLANRKFVEMARSPFWKTKTGGKLFTVRLMIGHIFAYTYDTIPEELKPKSMGVSTFLDFVSDRDYDMYCQAFFLTYRDFDGGITGKVFTIFFHPTLGFVFTQNQILNFKHTQLAQ